MGLAIDDAARTLRVSAVVPATDRPETLERCVEAIRRAADPPEELIVVDSPRESGPAAARNAGAERATGSVLVFVDSDVLVHEDAFQRIRSAFAASPGAVAVFGSYDDSPAADGVVSIFRNLLHHWIHQSSARRATTFWAGLGAVRRDAFMEVRGFDSARFPAPSVEDIELGLRLSGVGEIHLDPAIQGTHLKRWGLRSMVVTDLFYRGAPWVALMLARGRSSIRLNVSGRHLAGTVACLAAIAAAIAGRHELAALLAAAFIGINARLYVLLARRGGARAVAGGFLLHVLHGLIALAAAPIGLVAFAMEGRRRSRRARRLLPPLKEPQARAPSE